MKTLVSILFLLVFISSAAAQESSESDETLRQYFVGAWIHEMSVYPNGDVSDYYQEFEFHADGTGVCYRMEEEITTYMNVKWKIESGKVYLYSYGSGNSLVLGDIIALGHMDVDHFSGDTVFGTAAERKTCLYKRKDIELV